MPDLLLLRHAKSDWKDSSHADMDRPLNPRGQKAARAMGRFLATRPPVDMLWASPAARVQETVRGIRKVTDVLPDQQIVQALYGASVRTLLDLLHQARGQRLLMVGHNPGMHELAMRLSDGRASEARERMLAKYPTGSLAELRFDGEWADLREGGAELTGFTRPRDL
ncbi:histidine phosphatase family protein [Sphingomicrobium sp. XHP0239]|uniref:SixA phosphatase family protein n=1 Tax=Sphingomicrobium maritimum TaxID=3133972 RepID=UPI0031CCD730